MTVEPSKDQKIRSFSGKKVIDKRRLLMYNNSCVTGKRRIRIHIGKGQFGLWRNTQEAEEAPLLRV